MPRNRALATTLLGVFTLLVVGCYQPVSGDQAAGLSTPHGAEDVPTATPVLMLPAPVILSVDTPTPGPPRPVLVTATPLAAPSEVESVSTPAPIATSQPAAPTGTATPVEVPNTNATPDAEPADSNSPRTVEATPFTDVDLVGAIVARGLSYTPQGPRSGCTGGAADVRHLDGPDGPPVSLWVYPTSDELKADWILPSSGAPRPTIAGCEVDGGWIYWYENLVLAFEPQDEWIPESATRSAIVEAFFSLQR